MAIKVVVNIPGHAPYDVRIGNGQLEGLGTKLRAISSAPAAFVLTDSNVGPRYLEAVRRSLKNAGFRTTAVTIPAGEESKSVACVGELWHAMADAKLGRDALVVALGGGVVGDLAGFAASTYMRGVPFVQVPTTLLSMVDSSVGGKTGINLDAGKNLVGTFCQPLYVCASTDTLDTLDAREWACGCGEVAKSAAIEGDDFFFWLMEHAEAMAARDAAVVQEAIARCVTFKADVVARDEHESAGVRECLNYGHTYGHAVEKIAGYGVYSHGHAVAEGMRFAARLAVAYAGASEEFAQAQDELLDVLGLQPLDFAASPQEVLDCMKGDKKVRGGKLRYVLVHDAGDWSVETPDDEAVLEQLEAWMASKCA